MSNHVGRKISFDLKGTLDRHQDIMMPFLAKLRASGKTIYILTEALTVPARHLLEDLGYVHNTHYNIIVSIPVYLKLKEFSSKMDQTTCKQVFTEDVWFGSKALICEDARISAHFETNYRYGKFFAACLTRFIFLTASPLKQIETFCRKAP